jgi:hypothetical protein
VVSPQCAKSKTLSFSVSEIKIKEYYRQSIWSPQSIRNSKEGDKLIKLSRITRMRKHYWSQTTEQLPISILLLREAVKSRTGIVVWIKTYKTTYQKEPIKEICENTWRSLVNWTEYLSLWGFSNHIENKF